MSERFEIIWRKLNTGYWLLPSLMAFASIGLAYGALLLDTAMGTERMGAWWLGYTGGPDGARSVLSTIASSMINVAGVVFSITVVILSLATQQFGTYILRSFMRDFMNQSVLGTFIATFIYCLLTLRSVRGDEGLQSVSFIPYISVTLGLILALISLGLLIFFIHHLADSIKSSNLVARSGEEFLAAIDRLFPEEVGQPSFPAPMPPGVPGAVVRAIKGGYIQGVDGNSLVRLGARYDLLIVIRARPGSFVAADDELALIMTDEKRDIPEWICRKVQARFVIGRERTIDQDVSFGVEALVELAVRALSPGINNAVTASQCIDRMREGLARLACRCIPSPLRLDRHGVPRVYAEAHPFANILDLAFGRLIFVAREQPDTLLRLGEALDCLVPLAPTLSDQIAIKKHKSRIANFMRAFNDEFFQTEAYVQKLADSVHEDPRH
jgi:uncharacterized membrane protein